MPTTNDAAKPDRIARPAVPPSARKNEFVSCEGFTFRLEDVDGFQFRPAPTPGMEPTTAVFFATHSTTVPDPQKRLFNLLTGKFQPHVH